MKNQLLQDYHTAVKNKNFIKAGQIKAELKIKYKMDNKAIENDNLSFLKNILGIS